MFRFLPFFSAAILFFVHPVFAQNTSNSIKKTGSSKVKIQYGVASFYANKFNGKKTSNGEIFSQQKLTGAHNSLPLGTYVRVTNLKNGKTVIVKINDRLHHRNKRIIDLSKSAAQKLGYLKSGLTRVKLEVLGKKPPAK